MFKKLTQKFVKNHEDVNNPKVREKYGNFVSITGIIVNIFLSALKIVFGYISGAISMVSDGVNNVSDAATSIVTLVGFRLSNKKPDKKHPFGHGRIEYFAGLAVSVVIIVIAIELLIESIKKVVGGTTIIFKSDTVFILTVTVLALAIVMKLLLAILYRYIGKKINSVALKATYFDSLTDCLATLTVLTCTVLSKFIKGVPLDGIAGIVVSVFIAFTGIRSLVEVANVLLGEAPSAELVKEIADYVENFDKRVIGVHDLMVHDYGPGRKMLILHVEVPANGDIMELHDMIDNIEKGLEGKFHCITTIHMDPVDTESTRLMDLKEKCVEIVKKINPQFSLHDFRMCEGETHGNLIFDLVITHEEKMTADEIKNKIDEEIKKYDKKINVVINIEYSYV